MVVVIKGGISLCFHFLCEIPGSHGSEYKVQSSGMYCRVVKWMLTDVSEVRAAFIMRAMREPCAKI
jgi:hypothetical protein